VQGYSSGWKTPKRAGPREKCLYANSAARCIFQAPWGWDLRRRYGPLIDGNNEWRHPC